MTKKSKKVRCTNCNKVVQSNGNGHKDICNCGRVAAIATEQGEVITWPSGQTYAESITDEPN